MYVSITKRSKQSRRLAYEHSGTLIRKTDIYLELVETKSELKGFQINANVAPRSINVHLFINKASIELCEVVKNEGLGIWSHQKWHHKQQANSALLA